jgi:hypothetical protein
MFCLMNDDAADVKCECKCEAPAPSNQLIITSENSSCCQKSTIELSNSNNLQTYNKELPSDITSFSPVSFVIDSETLFNYSNSPFLSLDDQVPRAGIPILVSSLRI